MPVSSAVFLSYHSPDRTDIIAIQQVLQQHGIDTFLDRDNLALGLSWFEGLQDALGRARAVVVLLGPGELGVWQKREIALALDRQANLERTSTHLLVIPVLLPKAQPEQAPAFLLLNNGLILKKSIAEETQAITRLVQALGAATPDTPMPLTRPALCPYRGLDAFREEDAALFFGRDSFTENLLARVLHHPVVAVVGASGSGKSSVVQAGLLPQLRRQGGTAPTWDAVVCTPGTQPFHRLATALLPLLEPAASVTDQLVASGRLGDYLATGGYLSAVVAQAADAQQVDRLLVVVDQFEELFTQATSDQRTAFIAALLQATRDSKLRLVFTLRADFYGAVLGVSRDLSECLEKAQVALGPALPAELRQMIEEPALRAGLTFEPGLVPRILDDLTSQPGNLPLLEYALKGLWLARHENQLTHAGYEAIGEVVGAISKQAEAVFHSLSSTQQAASWRLFFRLVRVAAASEESTDTRRRIALDQLDEEAQQVAHRFAAPDVRLLVFSREQTTGDTTVEVAHEALIRTWARLRERLQEERTFLLWRQDLEKDVAEWRQLQSEQAVLYAGSKLEKAVQLTKGRMADLLPAEQAFLQQSQARAGKTGRVLKWAAGVALVLATALGGGWGWLHYTTKGQIARINYALSDLAATTTSSKVAYWSAARYLLTGNVDKALAVSESLPEERTLDLWDRLLQDSLTQQQRLLIVPRIESLYQRGMRIEQDPKRQGLFLRRAAMAYSKFISEGLVADKALQRLMADPRVTAPFYVSGVADAYVELIKKGALADSSLEHLLARTKKRPAHLEAIAAAYGKLIDKEAVADNGLKHVLAEARPLLKTNRGQVIDYPRILKSVVKAYCRLTSKGTVAEKGLQYALIEAKPLLSSKPYVYERILKHFVTAYSELIDKGVPVENGLQSLSAEAKPFLKTHPFFFLNVDASTYGKLINKGLATDNDIQHELVEAKSLLASDTSAYANFLYSTAIACGELTSKRALATAVLQHVLTEIKRMHLDTDIRQAVATANVKLIGNGALPDSGLQYWLAETIMSLKTNYAGPSSETIDSIAAAYGKLANAGKETLADAGLRHILAENKLLQKQRLTRSDYFGFLASIIAAYGKFPGNGTLATNGLQHILADTKQSKLEIDIYTYGSVLVQIATAYSELAKAGKSVLADIGPRHVLAAAKPLLESNSTDYHLILKTILEAYLADASSLGTHADLQQLNEAVENSIKENSDWQDVRILFAQLLAKHQRFAQAYEAVDKMPPDNRSQALYLILERYYRPASMPSALLKAEEENEEEN